MIKMEDSDKRLRLFMRPVGMVISEENWEDFKPKVWKRWNNQKIIEISLEKFGGMLISAEKVTPTDSLLVRVNSNGEGEIGHE